MSDVFGFGFGFDSDLDFGSDFAFESVFAFAVGPAAAPTEKPLHPARTITRSSPAATTANKRRISPIRSSSRRNRPNTANIMPVL